MKYGIIYEKLRFREDGSFFDFFSQKKRPEHPPFFFPSKVPLAKYIEIIQNEFKVRFVKINVVEKIYIYKNISLYYRESNYLFLF